jgi:hypothetical protein
MAAKFRILMLDASGLMDDSDPNPDEDWPDEADTCA